jgi:ERCC4-type nuclease
MSSTTDEEGVRCTQCGSLVRKKPSDRKRPAPPTEAKSEDAEQTPSADTRASSPPAKRPYQRVHASELQSLDAQQLVRVRMLRHVPGVDREAAEALVRSYATFGELMAASEAQVARVRVGGGTTLSRPLAKAVKLVVQ